MASDYIIRDVEQRDHPLLEFMCKTQALDFHMPDLNAPTTILKIVGENGHGPEMAVIGRLTAEAYLLIDHSSGTPVERWALLRALEREACKIGYEHGLDSVNVWLAPQIAERFGKRLEGLNWNRDLWPNYTKYLRG